MRQVHFLTSGTQLLRESYVQTRCKNSSPWTRTVAGGMEKWQKCTSKGSRMMAKFLVDARGKKSSPGARTILFGFRVTISLRWQTHPVIADIWYRNNNEPAGLWHEHRKERCVYVCVCVSVRGKKGGRKGGRRRKREIVLKRKCWGVWRYFILLRCVYAFSRFLSLHSKVLEEVLAKWESALSSATSWSLASNVPFFSPQKWTIEKSWATHILSR